MKQPAGREQVKFVTIALSKPQHLLVKLAAVKRCVTMQELVRKSVLEAVAEEGATARARA